ncbi:ras and ef-hand domain-containing protein [Anaeramoeba ignava]|uniref:Ras and ef-hand domain-containing protein n=1 Tax=Anaeramoeba ignava TaxID=1746090 RepID=A0A9Q0LZN2_ANAIG|nr:ras and ef-hand domain-containing protein [Anaeramoeba ignava]
MEFNQSNSSRVLKILIVGDSNVGKSCVLLNFCESKFRTETDSTIGVDFRFADIIIHKKPIKLQIWDTAGQEKFRSITNTYYRTADGIMITYDLTNKESFSQLSEWFVEINSSAPEDTQLILIANKKDLEEQRQVSFSEGENFAQTQNCPFLEVSAKTGENIKEAFHILAKNTLKSANKKKEETIALDKKGRSHCC